MGQLNSIPRLTIPGIGFPLQYAYDEQPMVGTSIGTSSSDASGSLGFYIKVQAKDSEPDYFALTCHHVIAPSTYHLSSIY